MPRALRQGDMHACQKINKATKLPHVGGPGGLPTPPSCSSVLINGRHVLTQGDAALCIGQPETPDKIVRGIRSILIGNSPAADANAKTKHGGKFTTGSSDVLFG